MLLHMLRMLSRALVDFPTVISGNWLSIALPLAVFITAESLNYRKGGWNAVTPTLKRDAYIMGAAYLLLFGWSVVRTIYQDHSDLVARSQQLGATLQSTRTQDSNLLHDTQNGLGKTITDLKVQCARDEGVSDTLGEQNRDQQNTINNCQTQALKLLVPEPLKITPLVLEPATGGIEIQHVKWLILTNKTITPVSLMVLCQKRFTSASAWIVGAGMLAGGTSKVTDTQYQVDISSPAWTPQSPILFTMSFIGDQNNACSFRER